MGLSAAERQRAYRARKHPGRIRRLSRLVKSTWPPPDVIAEAARAIAGARDLTASLMGDPLPGRSALDRQPK